MLRQTGTICLCLALWGSAFGASISGKITPAGKVVKVSALSRKSTLSGKGKLYKQKTMFPEFPGTINKSTGEFTIPKLENGRYDILIQLAGGGRIEGYRLKLDREYRRDKPLDEKTRAKAWKDIDSLLKVDAFCNKIRVLSFEGNGAFVVTMTEKARTREFHSDKGEAIYRIEQWVLVNYTGSWKHHSHGNVVYYRKRMTKDAFSKMAWIFEPKLGGIRVRKDKDVTDVNYEILPWDRCRHLGKTPGYIFDEPLK